MTGKAGQAPSATDGRGVIDEGYSDAKGAPATEGAITHDQDDAAERQFTLGGGSSSTGD